MKKILFLNLSLLLLQIFTSSIALDVTQYGAIGDGVRDDSQAFLKAWEAVCSGTRDGKLVVPAGKTFMLQPLKFQGSCKSAPIFVQILGTLVATNKGNWKGDKDWWILFTDIEGLVVEGNGVINGQGSSWWEHKGSRPTAMKFKSCNNLRLNGLTHMDSPMAHIHINDCNNATISNLRINAPESSPNTDGIDVATSSNVVIQDCVIATGDDCIAINSGTSNIQISGIDCGPGHGISIGSLGKDGAPAAVENVCVQNCNFRGTTNGARIKTWQGGSGYARMITFHGITLDNVKNPIIIDQFYDPGSSEKTKNPKLSAVQVSKVMYSNFVGTSKSKYGIDFSCSATVPCTEVFLKDVKIEKVLESGQVAVAQGQCSNVRGVTTLAVPGLECLTNNTKMLSSSQLPDQTCMSGQIVQPRTPPMQVPPTQPVQPRTPPMQDPRTQPRSPPMQDPRTQPVQPRTPPMQDPPPTQPVQPRTPPMQDPRTQPVQPGTPPMQDPRTPPVQPRTPPMQDPPSTQPVQPRTPPIQDPPTQPVQPRIPPIQDPRTPPVQPGTPPMQDPRTPPVQPGTPPMQDPRTQPPLPNIDWVYESGGKRLTVSNTILISFISLVIFFILSGIFGYKKLNS